MNKGSGIVVRANRAAGLRLGGLLTLIAAILVASFSGAYAQTSAAASEWAGELDKLPARARLIAATTGVGQLDRIPVGVEIELRPGFKTYWRTPGGPGFPTTIDWDGSANLADTDFKWPGPTRFDVLGFDSLGYKKHVVFPILVRPDQVGRELRLRANVRFLACDEICVPMEADLALDLPTGSAEPSAYANLIDKYRARVPASEGALVGIELQDASLRGPSEAPVVQVAFNAEEPFVVPDLFVEGPETVVFGRPTLQRSATTAVFSVPVENEFGEGPVDLAGQSVRLTLVDRDRAFEANVTLNPGGPDLAASNALGGADSGTGNFIPGLAPDGGGTGLSLWTVLGFALLGGLILNVFPCVLPVLSIKLLSVIGHGGGKPRAVRVGFLATVAGIIAAFLVLASLVVGLKAAGQTVGWGIQFQQPLFLVAMVLILTLFAANMWGLFEVRLPGRLADAAARGSGGSGLKGHFFSGGFATLLATPCTAPFLTTAVGFALTRGTGDIYAVFTALGVGLAAPFILVAAFPGMVTRLPRPGPWMITVKKILSLALVATAVWLLWVMSAQVSTLAALVVAGLMVAAVIVIALRRRLSAQAVWGAPALVVLLAVLAFTAPQVLPRAELEAVAGQQATVAYRAFDEAAIPRLVEGGKVVLVHVTADWCITCKVNEKRVLQAGDVATALNRDEVVVMKADWTRPDDEIAVYLASFDRFGIPFDIVYGPASPEGSILPELLTANAVLTALRSASPNLRVVLN